MLATGSVETEQSDPSSMIMGGCDIFISLMKLLKVVAASHWKDYKTLYSYMITHKAMNYIKMLKVTSQHFG